MHVVGELVWYQHRNQWATEPINYPARVLAIRPRRVVIEVTWPSGKLQTIRARPNKVITKGPSV